MTACYEVAWSVELDQHALGWVSRVTLDATELGAQALSRNAAEELRVLLGVMAEHGRAEIDMRATPLRVAGRVSLVDSRLRYAVMVNGLQSEEVELGEHAPEAQALSHAFEQVFNLARLSARVSTRPSWSRS